MERPKSFFPKRKKVDAKYLKTCIKFVLFYSLLKKDVNLQKKKQKSWARLAYKNLARQFFLQQLSYMVH